MSREMEMARDAMTSSSDSSGRHLIVPARSMPTQAWNEYAYIQALKHIPT
jgi:hypothetical protein